MKTFVEHLTEQADPKLLLEYLEQADELTAEQEKAIDEAVDRDTAALDQAVVGGVQAGMGLLG